MTKEVLSIIIVAVIAVVILGITLGTSREMALKERCEAEGRDDARPHWCYQLLTLILSVTKGGSGCSISSFLPQPRGNYHGNPNPTRLLR